MTEKVSPNKEELRQRLTPEQYHITQEKGTERPFTGEYYYLKNDGTYRCVVCGNELFSSETKYESGSGWPSFWAPISEENVDEKRDLSLGMVRTEVRCDRCGAHLGHVFNDGPQPTGMRYCINSAALQFVDKKDKS
jgi:peptide-methionine (R)-S-oxide reductase